MKRAQRSLVLVRRGCATGSSLALTLVLASGCAMFGGSDPVPPFATVAVVARGQSEMDLEADDTTKSALVGGGAGAVSGAVIGGAALGTAAVGSGPFALIAVVIGGLQGLPAEKAEEVTRVLAGLAQTRDFPEELRSAVEAAVPAGRRATLDQAEARAILQFTELGLEQHLSDAVSIRTRAKMNLEWGPSLEDPDSRSYDYEYQTPERHVDEWLAENGAAFAAAFTETIDAIAGQMSRDILSPAPQ